MNITAMLVEADSDNVGVVTAEMKKGDVARFRKGDAVVEITLRDDIPIYHKFCVTPIREGAPVIKYGEHLGLAGRDISAGEYVHTHNLVSQREQ